MHAARVGVAVDRGRRADDADPPPERGRHRGARAGLDDIEHRDAGTRRLNHVRLPPAAMVLHAMISIFTSRWSRNSVICAVKCSMVATDLTP